MAINYVKFQRGSKSAYLNLKRQNRIEENTLYFIYSENNSELGELYLGNRLISGSDITITSSTSIKDLTDVIINNTGENSFLVLDSNNKWVSKSLNDIIAIIKSKDDIDNFITSVSSEFTITPTGTLTLNAISIKKVANLEQELEKKVNAIDGHRLLTPIEAQKLDKLILDSDGTVGVAGDVKAENVQGLDEAIQQQLFISSVNTDFFSVVNKKLDFNDTFNNSLNALISLKGQVGNLNDLENRLSENSTIVNEINNLKRSTIWSEI